MQPQHFTTADVASTTGVSAFPALTQLDLGPAEIRMLRRQGFVRAERRGQRSVYKLRFRDESGRQLVRCIRNADLAQLVESELRQLQEPRQRRLELSALSEAARAEL